MIRWRIVITKDYVINLCYFIPKLCHLTDIKLRCRNVKKCRTLGIIEYN